MRQADQLTSLHGGGGGGGVTINQNMDHEGFPKKTNDGQISEQILRQRSVSSVRYLRSAVTAPEGPLVSQRGSRAAIVLTLATHER